MKIDKTKPLHWLYLSLFGVVTLLSLLLRPFVRKQNVSSTVVLYGHKLNSNLKGIYDYSISSRDSEISVYYLTMDPAYYRALKAEGVNVLLATKLSTAIVIARAACIVSDHGLHMLVLLLKLTNIKFVDVWHGIPFKGFDAEDFKVQRRYDEVWVTSEFVKKLYVRKFGFSPDIVHVTGYARTDILINNNADLASLKAELGLPLDKKVILFAPTWQQDDDNRTLFPFGVQGNEFWSTLDQFSEEHNTTLLFRSHLNSADLENVSYPNIYFAPHAEYPDTEQILLLADIMVCDWSSIAFDYLLLDRPTIFLDVPAPFRKGFSLDESYRFGEVVKDFPSMLSILRKYILDVEIYWKKYGDRSQVIKNALYDDKADGKAGERCLERLSAM